MKKSLRSYVELEPSQMRKIVRLLVLLVLLPVVQLAPVPQFHQYQFLTSPKPGKSAIEILINRLKLFFEIFKDDENFTSAPWTATEVEQYIQQKGAFQEIPHGFQPNQAVHAPNAIHEIPVPQALVSNENPQDNKDYWNGNSYETENSPNNYGNENFNHENAGTPDRIDDNYDNGNLNHGNDNAPNYGDGNPNNNGNANSPDYNGDNYVNANQNKYGNNDNANAGLNAGGYPVDSYVKETQTHNNYGNNVQENTPGYQDDNYDNANQNNNYNENQNQKNKYVDNENQNNNYGDNENQNNNYGDSVDTNAASYPNEIIDNENPHDYSNNDVDANNGNKDNVDIIEEQYLSHNEFAGPNNGDYKNNENYSPTKAPEMQNKVSVVNSIDAKPAHVVKPEKEMPMLSDHQIDQNSIHDSPGESPENSLDHHPLPQDAPAEHVMKPDEQLMSKITKSELQKQLITKSPKEAQCVAEIQRLMRECDIQL